MKLKMLFDSKYYEDKGYMLTIPPQILLLTDVLAHFDRITNDPSIQKPFFEIVDFSNTKEIDFGYEDAKKLMGKIVELKRHDKYQGSLLIANTDYIRGMTNIYRVVGESAKINIVQVTSLDRALDIVNERIA
ncbi:MAG: hypothetical protein IIB72_03795 [Proteobacteria bacterium]|nr:hypothetical protein [Pseudomonadota bacterium]